MSDAARGTAEQGSQKLDIADMIIDCPTGNSFTVSMISVSQIYTNRFSKQKYKSSAWTSVNLVVGVVGII